MLDHVGIPVSDFERSKRFYEQAISPLGYELIMEPRYGAAGLGRSGKPDFWVFQGESGHAVHVAFVSDDRATVEAFFEAAIAAGATTAVSGFAPSTIRPTLGASSSIRTAMRGFVSYFILVPSEREEDIVSVSVFEDQQSAEESNRKAAEWVVQDLSELLRPTPEFASGQVVVYEASQ